MQVQVFSALTSSCALLLHAGALVANTQLLRALLASPSSPAVQQRLSAWLLLWLEALATSPLAAAGIALKQDLPVLLSALLGDQQAGGRAAAGMRNVPPLGGAGGLQAEQWLPLLAAAAAQTDEVDAAEVQEGSQQQQQQDSDDEAADAGESRGWQAWYLSKATTVCCCVWFQ
jgi:hypothetical protein